MSEYQSVTLNPSAPELRVPQESDVSVNAGSQRVAGFSKAGKKAQFDYLTGNSSKNDLHYAIAQRMLTPEVGDVIEVTAYSSTSAKYPATWKCTATDAALPSGATAGDVTGNALGVLYVLKSGSEYYSFEPIGDELHAAVFGAVGDDSEQYPELDAAFQFCAANMRALNLGGKEWGYTTSTAIEVDLSLDFPGYFRVFGDGAKITNTVSDVIIITGSDKQLAIFDGFQIIGSTDDFVTRSAFNGLTVETTFGVTFSRLFIAGFAIGLRSARGLWSLVDDCRFRYCDDHCILSNVDLEGDSVSSNVCEVRRCIFWGALTNGDAKVKSTDKCLTILTSVNTRVIQNTFEFPQEHGLRLNRNRVAVVESNYFEHGNGGYDILIDGTASFNDYTRIGQNHHHAGSGDGGVSGGHSPFSSSGGKMIILANNVGGYHADNIDEIYISDAVSFNVTNQLVREINIVPLGEGADIAQEDYRLRLSEANIDISRMALVSGTKNLPGSTATDVFEIDTGVAANFGIEVTLYHGRNTNGTGGGMSKAYATYYNSSGTLSVVNALAQTSSVGTCFSWSATLSGSKVTYALTSTTGNTHYANWSVRLFQTALGSDGIRAKIAAL